MTTQHNPDALAKRLQVEFGPSSNSKFPSIDIVDEEGMAVAAVPSRLVDGSGRKDKYPTGLIRSHAVQKLHAHMLVEGFNFTYPQIGLLTVNQRSVLLYAESCLVDQGGFMESKRMNKQDHEDLAVLQESGYLTWGRVPAAVLFQIDHIRSDATHWVRFTTKGWAAAQRLRRERHAVDNSVSKKKLEAYWKEQGL